MMIQRCMTILAEAQNVWPLASRWIEGLEKFVNDNKGAVAGLEGSMADGVSDLLPSHYISRFVWCLLFGHAEILT